MKRMHRCLSLLLALAFALALVGCGGQPQEEESEVSTPCGWASAAGGSAEPSPPSLPRRRRIRPPWS